VALQVSVSSRDLDIAEPDYSDETPPASTEVYDKITRDPLVGLRVLITSGQYKGYRGLIKSTRNAIVQVELEAGLTVITIQSGMVLNHR
jgi:transcription elongation factor